MHSRCPTRLLGVLHIAASAGKGIYYSLKGVLNPKLHSLEDGDSVALKAYVIDAVAP